jgi:hypothetical protein
LKEIGICLENPVSRSFRVVRGQNLWVAGMARFITTLGNNYARLIAI